MGDEITELLKRSTPTEVASIGEAVVRYLAGMNDATDAASADAVKWAERDALHCIRTLRLGASK